jgi:hypothetical protein
MVIWDKDLICKKNPKGFFEGDKNENSNGFRYFGNTGKDSSRVSHKNKYD